MKRIPQPLRIVCLSCALVLGTGNFGPMAAGQSSAPGRTDPDLRLTLSAAQLDLIARTREYRESTQAYLDVLEAQATRLREKLDKERELFESGLIPRMQMDSTRAALHETEGQMALRRSALATADHLIVEVQASLESPGADELEPRVVRFNGRHRWDSEELTALAGFFERSFGEPLPVSANGQTETHQKLGFDHTQRVDVAVHPDTPEGRAVMAYLRQKDIPFIAFSAPIEGSATGAHIHIGLPSLRTF